MTTNQPVTNQLVTTSGAPVRRRVTGFRPVGGVALRALEGGLAWHLKGVAACLLLPWIALIYIAVALVQLRNAAGDSRLARTRIALGVYGALAALPLLFGLVGLVARTL